MAGVDKSRERFNKLQGRGEQENREGEAYTKLFEHRDFWPLAQKMVADAIRSVKEVAADQALLSAGGEGLKKLKAKPRDQRKIVIVESLTASYHDDLAGAALLGDARPLAAPRAMIPTRRERKGAKRRQPAPPRGRRGFRMELLARTPMPRGAALTGLITPLKNNIAAAGGGSLPFEVIGEVKYTFPKIESTDRPGHAGGSGAAAGAKGEPAGPKNPDPAFPGEDMSNDTRFLIVWKLAVRSPDSKTAPNTGR